MPVKKKGANKIKLKIGICAVIFIAVLFGALLYLSSHSSLGSINNPYNSSIGYQGSGYYSYQGAKFYAVNMSQFNNKISTTTSSTSIIITTVPTTSVYYTTTQPTTTINEASLYGCSTLPCTTFKNGNFTFIFTLLNGSVEQWHFPLTSYNYWVSTPRVDPILRLNDTITGKTIYTYDYRPTVTPSFFANVTSQLTNGKTAGQFVAEVQNINSELVNYSLIFDNTSVYPAQILAQGQGDCKDKGVLIASILEAGNIQANYGMKIQFVYVDADNLTAPRTANHLLLYITFENGTSKFIDTTDVLATSPYFNGTVDGWYYNLTCTMASCQSAPLCTGSVCDAVGYSVGSSTGFNYCKSGGYVVAANNTCEYECGTYSYCNSGYSCYNNNCESCQQGYVLGSDGLCHQECGSSTTYCTASDSYCYNNQCVSCPSGDYLATNGYCYPDGGSSSTPTTTIQSSGSGSCSNFELTESSPDASTSGSCTWSGGYLNVSENEGTFEGLNVSIIGGNAGSSTSIYVPIYTYPSCQTIQHSEYLPAGTFNVYVTSSSYGSSCSNSYGYVQLSS